MAQTELWEDSDYESDTDVRYDFVSEEETDEEDSRGLFGKPYRRSNYEDFQKPVRRKRRKPLIEVEPREPREPIPIEKPRKTKAIEEDRRTKTKNEIDKRKEYGKQFYEEANKYEKEGDEEAGEEEEAGVDFFGEKNKDEEEVDEKEDVEVYGEPNKDEEESGNEEEEEDYEEYYGEEYIIRPEDLETPYPKETLTPEEENQLLEEIATMLGPRDGTPDPDAFIPLDLMDGLEIGDEKWKAMMAQISKPHPYEEYMPQHHKTPAEMIWETWDRQDYNEGRYVDPDEYKDGKLTPEKDIDFQEIQNLAKMMEEGKPIPDYYQ